MKKRKVVSKRERRCIIGSVLFVIVGGIMLISSQNPHRGATSAQGKYTKYVFNENAATEYVKQKCRDNGITGEIDVKKGNGRINYSRNYDQGKLLANLNKSGRLGSTVDAKNGICWAAATVSILEALGASTSPYTKPTADDLFFMTVKTAYENAYITPSTINLGLHSKYQSLLLTKLFPKYRLTNYYCKANYKKQSEIYDMVSACVNRGSVTMFTIPEHMMCGCGYDNFIAQYKIKAGTQELTQSAYNYFVVVNDTWTDNSINQYSYYPREKIVDVSAADILLDNIFCTTFIDRK